MGFFLFLTSFELGRWVKLEDLILEGEMRLSSPPTGYFGHIAFVTFSSRNLSTLGLLIFCLHSSFDLSELDWLRLSFCTELSCHLA